MDPLPLLLALLGGLLAGCISLVVGGVGGIWETRRAVRRMADMVADLDQRITREIKSRAGQASLESRSRRDPLVDQLVQRAQEPPGSTIDGGGAMVTPPKTGAEVLARARRLGVIR